MMLLLGTIASGGTRPRSGWRHSTANLTGLATPLIDPPGAVLLDRGSQPSHLCFEAPQSLRRRLPISLLIAVSTSGGRRRGLEEELAEGEPQWSPFARWVTFSTTMTV
jgi:hypothetical protein